MSSSRSTSFQSAVVKAIAAVLMATLVAAVPSLPSSAAAADRSSGRLHPTDLWRNPAIRQAGNHSLEVLLRRPKIAPRHFGGTKIWIRKGSRPVGTEHRPPRSRPDYQCHGRRCARRHTVRLRDLRKLTRYTVTLFSYDKRHRWAREERTNVFAYRRGLQVTGQGRIGAQFNQGSRPTAYFHRPRGDQGVFRYVPRKHGGTHLEYLHHAAGSHRWTREAVPGTARPRSAAVSSYLSGDNRRVLTFLVNVRNGRFGYLYTKIGAKRVSRPTRMPGRFTDRPCPRRGCPEDGHERYVQDAVGLPHHRFALLVRTCELSGGGCANEVWTFDHGRFSREAVLPGPLDSTGRPLVLAHAIARDASTGELVVAGSSSGPRPSSEHGGVWVWTKPKDRGWTEPTEIVPPTATENARLEGHRGRLAAARGRVALTYLSYTKVPPGTPDAQSTSTFRVVWRDPTGAWTTPQDLAFEPQLTVGDRAAGRFHLFGNQIDRRHPVGRSGVVEQVLDPEGRLGEVSRITHWRGDQLVGASLDRDGEPVVASTRY